MEIEKEGLASLRVDGYRDSSPEMCLILTGYFQQFVDLSKLPSPRITKRQCVSRGDPRCEWELRWG